MSSPHLDEGLRARALARLQTFRRQALGPGPGRPAAVAVVLLPDGAGRACFLLTRRAAGLRAHATQFALPGGRVDPGEGPVDAVLRELGEEVGLRLGREACLGLLDDYPTRSGFVITPVVLWCGEPVRVTPNPAEVAAIYRVAVAELDGPGVPRLARIPESDRPLIQLPLGATVIYAPTAAILYQFREVVLHGRPTRVSHFEQPVWAWS